MQALSDHPLAHKMVARKMVARKMVARKMVARKMVVHKMVAHQMVVAWTGGDRNPGDRTGRVGPMVLFAAKASEVPTVISMGTKCCAIAWTMPSSSPPSPMNSAADEAPYFGIFNAKGMVIRTSSEAVTFPTMNSNRQMEFRPNGDYREILLRGPSNSIIVVGRDARRHFNRLTGWMLQLLGSVWRVGLGLVGGWWLTGRAIRPILDISQTATKVTAKNLAQRIDTSRMDQELRELGSVLNSMLGRLDQAFEIQTNFRPMPPMNCGHRLRCCSRTANWQ